MIEALVWFSCAAVALAIFVMVIRSSDKNAYQFFLMGVLILLCIVCAANAAALIVQNFKSIEITDNGETILLRQFGRTVSIRPDEITQVKLEEKYLLYSFSTKPLTMLIVEAPGISWQIRSDIITNYDRVLNYFMESGEPE